MRLLILIVIVNLSLSANANTYNEGTDEADQYLQNSNDSKAWFMGGVGAGLICPGCGCIAAPLTGYFFKAEVPEQFNDRSSEFKTGFRKIYVSEIKKMRAKYAFAGAGIGSVLSIAVISYIIYTLM
ncbi:MAG: hypothetical protein SVK54_05340 [candidate division WOR-3 bacterium]|nr:hypothetical protein [candidate division WOR-3 bacterium]